MKPQKFPLSWPQGYPVAERRTESKFNCTMAQARDGIITELSRLRTTDVIISTNVQIDKRGLIAAAGRLVYDNPGVAVYFKFKGEEKVVCCDKWLYLHENLRAVEKSIEAIRGLDRWGCSDIISRAMGDMKALPQNAGNSTSEWWQVLELTPEATLGEAIVAAKRLKVRYHPDNMATGDEEKFKQVQEALDKAKTKLS